MNIDRIYLFEHVSLPNPHGQSHYLLAKDHDFDMQDRGILVSTHRLPSMSSDPGPVLVPWTNIKCIVYEPPKVAVGLPKPDPVEDETTLAEEPAPPPTKAPGRMRVPRMAASEPLP